MKKFYTLAAAALAALSMNATIYVVGSGDGLGWDLPGKAYEGTGDVYEFSINNLSQFKFSTVYSTEWDGDNGYNSGAFATGETTFGDAVYGAGQTLPIVSWGLNQELPWLGDYTIKIDLNAMTMTAKTTTPKPTSGPDVYVRGDMNGWLNGGADNAWKFTYSASTDEYVLNCTINKGQAFKIADMNWNKVNYGGNITSLDGTPNVLTYDGANLMLTADFTGNVVFKITGEKAATVAFKSGDAPIDPDPTPGPGGDDTDYSDWWVNCGGPFNDNDFYNGGVQPVDGIATFTGQAIGTQGFKMKTWDGATDVYYIADTTYIAQNTWVQFYVDEYDVPVFIEGATEGEVFTVKFNLNNKQVMVTSESSVSIIEAENAAPVYYNLQGVRVENPSNGLYIRVQGNQISKEIVR